MSTEIDFRGNALAAASEASAAVTELLSFANSSKNDKVFLFS